MNSISNAGEKVEVKISNQMCLCQTACDDSRERVCWGGGEGGEWVISVWSFALFGHLGFSTS